MSTAVRTQDWPPNYHGVYARRKLRIAALKKSARAISCSNAFYSAHPVEFIEDWVSTYDPRNADGGDRPPTLPFILFPKQRDLVTFLVALIDAQAPGLVEKSRDMGATWICCALTVWIWKYRPGASESRAAAATAAPPSSSNTMVRLIVENASSGGDPTIFFALSV